jgi:class 3 adenylate cyclase
MQGFPGLSPDHPLPLLKQFGDPVLYEFWDGERYELVVETDEEVAGHVIRVAGDDYVFLYREIDDFGSPPWIVGSYFQARAIGGELRRLLTATIAGGVTVLLAVLIAILVGRRIAIPITRLAAAADQLRDLEFGAVDRVPPSRLRELNEAAVAFNNMLVGLRWFEAYVPKRLIERLIRRTRDGQLESEERQVTVMFTDIADFTPLSEALPAADVATLLNRHFEMLTGCVEAEGGTVDKFIGDGMMAFWGAPDAQPDHASRAARAALAIAAAVHADNTARAGTGQPVIRVRIGLHSGNAVVGNIGSAGRLNYTLVGDTVNIGSRLEQLGKQLADAGSDCSILVSGATAAALEGGFRTRRSGEFNLRGREETVEVFLLE